MIMPLGFWTSPGDWAIVLVVALVVLGPSKLPEFGRQLGKTLRDLRKVADEVTGATQAIGRELSDTTAETRSGFDLKGSGARRSAIGSGRVVSTTAPAEDTARSTSRGVELRLSTDPIPVLSEKPGLGVASAMSTGDTDGEG
ncbi:MAG: twin-arginine translocase TatA/TatE family subunit [Capsulimonadaceae bacterium]